MDLSKLPRLSETNKEPPPASTPELDQPLPAQRLPNVHPAAAYEPRAAEPVAASGDVWISLAVGVVLLLMQPRFLLWVSSRVFGTHFNEFLKPDGAVVPYPQVPEFWGDLGPTLFAFVLILEGITLAFSRNRAVLALAFGLTVLATGYNAIYLVMTYSTYGLALLSALAVVFGVYIARYQWTLLKAYAAAASR
jgi:hypothetical protein